MSHKVCVDPADRACIDTSDLEQGGHLWVACSSLHEKDITHPPGILFCQDNIHAWFDAQEEGGALWDIWLLPNHGLQTSAVATHAGSSSGFHPWVCRDNHICCADLSVT